MNYPILSEYIEAIKAAEERSAEGRSQSENFEQLKHLRPELMQTGGQTYIPLSKQSKLAVGDELDIKAAKLITLSRKGSADITRVIE